MRDELRLHAAHGAAQHDHRVERMQAGAGEAAAGGFGFERAPAARHAVRVLVAVVPLDMQELAQIARVDDALQRLHRGPEAPVVADGENDARAPARIQHRLAVRDGQRQWLLAEHVLAGLRGGDRLLAVQRVRRGEHHRLNGGVAQQIGEVRAFGWVGSGREADALALARHRFHQAAAPAPQPDHRGVHHARFIPARCRPAGCRATTSRSPA